jgi:FMN-dependent oxidoreductase (nitrilotriacetate monooxygenase family)
VVSSLQDAPAKNFGIAPLTHPQRYERAAEFVDVAQALWDSWDDDAFDHVDRQNAIFYDPASIHPVKYEGKHFSVEGVLDLPRPVQGYPVFVQAGNSDTGRDFAARIAEMTYCSATSLEVAQGYYSDIKSRAARFGRDPDQIKITPGLSVTVAETQSEAQARFDELQDLIDFSHVVLAGVDLSGHPLDGPLPELPDVENGKGRRQQLVDLAKRENLTIRQLVKRFAVSRGHLQIVGSPKIVADKIEEWFTQGGADGFNVVPPLLPRGFEDFTRLVVPELQRRGLFRTEYEGSTLREHLGLDRPGDASWKKASAA